MGPSIWQLIIILIFVLIPLKLSAKSSAKWKEKICEFRDLAGLVNVLKISVGVYIVTAIASLWFTWSQNELLERIASGGSITEGEATTHDTLQELIGGVHSVVSLINARSFNATDMKYSPAWVVGWYFVPFLGWWK